MFYHLLFLLFGATALSGGCSEHRSEKWLLSDITGHLPELQFNLKTADNPNLTAADFRGRVTLVFFGYARCPDICPMTMSKLGGVLRMLGDDADSVRILFISVDPKLDTPVLLRDYAAEFSPQAVGATGSAAEIEALARRYRVAYQATPPDVNGEYEIMHSKAVYVFDGKGDARLMISDSDTLDAIAHDLKALLRL